MARYSKKRYSKAKSYLPTNTKRIEVSSSLSRKSVLRLHYKYGNSVVQKLFNAGILQTKLKSGRPGDNFEREADLMADRVVNSTDKRIQKKSA